MKKYNELIQFEPVTTTIQLKDAADHSKAEQLISSYVISGKMKSKLNDIIIKHLQYEEFADNKALWIVGNYGSGKSHLMSVISALAEFPDLVEKVTDEDVRKSADKIAGKFKVIRFEIGASKMDLTDIITYQLTKGLEDLGVSYDFPPMDQITSNHKQYVEQMMSVFHEKYPEHGLLLICDEILDYFRSRNQQQLPLDMAMLRVLGEVIEGTRFRFIAGVQEAIFADPKLSFISKEVKRITDRAVEVVIVRDDIKFVVAERLLKKTAQQQAWIREYLQKFTPYYDKMNERLEEFVHMFPVHPDYINTFERVRIAGLEQRQVLRSLSNHMNKLMTQDVPEDVPGIFSYDSYWHELSAEPSMKTNPEVGQVIETGETLLERIEQAYPTPGEKDFAKRLVAGLAIHRMAVGDIYKEMGATAAELRDSLCLYLGVIDGMPGDKSKNLETHIVTVLNKIRKTVNGQFFSRNKANDQFYIDLKKTEDFDAYIENKATTLANDNINGAYRAAMLEILEQSDTQQVHTMWQHELKWIDRNVNRQGWLFLGSPNERETAKPQRDYYMYFIQPVDAPKQKKEHIREDEVLFVLKNRDEDFERYLKYYAASVELRALATGSARNTYKLKADDYLREMQKWIRNHIADAFEVKYNGQSKPIMDWLKGTSVRDITGIAANEHGNVKDIFEAVASYIFSGYFQSLAPDYPKFSQWITGDNMQGAAKDVLISLSSGARTKRATAVMDALELLEGDKLKATNSRYSTTVLDILKHKGHGQVVNNSELLEQVNANLYFKPSTYRLEPEWLLVILASLVYSGELELSVVGNNITASNTDLLKTLDFDDLMNFKHIQAPKDFNTSAIKALLELLAMNEGLATSIQQGDDSIVREMSDKIEVTVKALVCDAQTIKERLPLWGQHVLEEKEAELLVEKLSLAKSFLEEMQRFNTPGKLKNLKASAEEITLQKENLVAWNNFKHLEATVNEFTDITNYLGKAQLVLSENDDWQESVENSQQELRLGLADPSTRQSVEFKQKMLKQLAEVKQSYITRFVSLYQRSHLTLAEDKIKAGLMNDDRLAALDLLSGIALLPGAQVKDWREKWANLQPASDIDNKKLAVSPNPVAYNPRTEGAVAPANNRLTQLDDQLDAMLTEWTSTLKSNLADPFIQLDLMKASQKSEVEDFIDSGCLPDPLTKAFIEEVNKVLGGLVPVNISSQDLVASLGKGTPQSVDDIRKRFESLIAERCKGQDSDKVRIVIG
jgi:predicted ATPase